MPEFASIHDDIEFVLAEYDEHSGRGRGVIQWHGHMLGGYGFSVSGCRYTLYDFRTEFDSCTIHVYEFGMSADGGAVVYDIEGVVRTVGAMIVQEAHRIDIANYVNANFGNAWEGGGVTSRPRYDFAWWPRQVRRRWHWLEPCWHV